MLTRPNVRPARRHGLLFLLLAAGETAAAGSSTIVISQVYGGGGNSGATYKYDFIELHNNATTNVTFANWSVQYQSKTATGSFNAKTDLATLSIPAGGYFLVQEASENAANGSELPTADAIGSIGLSANDGKVALVNSTTLLGSNASNGPTIVDFVGYGGANGYEGSGRAPAPGNTSSAQRKLLGLQDTDDNAADFVTGTPVPRNASSPAVRADIALVFTSPSVATTTVDYAASTTDLAGVASNLVGRLSWTNALNAAAGTVTAAESWTVTGVSLGVGTNTLTASGTNAAGMIASASVAFIRQPAAIPAPVLTITNPPSAPLTVKHGATAFALSGSSLNLVGLIAWTNAWTADGGTGAAADQWSFAVPLAVGTNAFTVTGTNAAGTAAAGSATIVRPPPSLVVTNPFSFPWYVENVVTDVDLAGFIDSLTNQVQWTNALTGASGTPAPAASWSDRVALSFGTNSIVFTANAGSLAVTASVVRLAATGSVLRAGDVSVIGMDTVNDEFSFVTFVPLMAGSVVYFTDKGWSNGLYRGASASGGSGSEDLVKFLATVPIAAGSVVRSSDAGSSVEWVRSGSIPHANGHFGALDTTPAGDQVYAFQSSYSNPLYSVTANLFVLDNTGAFEPATDSNTGDVATGLTTGVTALTFAGNKAYMAFTNFDGHARTKLQWLAMLANSNNWQFSSSGSLPTGAFAVLPPPDKGSVLLLK